MRLLHKITLKTMKITKYYLLLVVLRLSANINNNVSDNEIVCNTLISFLDHNDHIEPTPIYM